MTKEEIEEYDRLDKAIRDENVGLLAGFRDWLTTKTLSRSTISKHINYADAYMQYLLYYDVYSCRNSVDFYGFFGWYDRKCTSGKSKEAYASLKKYYTFLHENQLANDSMIEQVKEAKEYFDDF